MRLFVTAVALACASQSLAQTQVADISAQAPAIAPQAPMRSQRTRRMGPSGTAAGNVRTPEVDPGTAIVTLKGVCTDRQAKSPCQTIITRADLDSFAKSTSPDAPEAERSRLAIQYASAMAYSGLAEQQGLEKNPELAKQLALELKLVRMRFLATALLQNLQKRTAIVTEPEVQKYYTDHQSQFEQAQVRRLAVPFSVPTEDGRPLDRSVVRSKLEEARSRALAGGDFNQLQQDVFKELQIQATPPPMNVLTLRRSSVQGEEAKVLDLSPGEISAVLEAPAALVLMKLESKEPVPINSVRPEIEAAVRQERMQEALRKLGKDVNTDFNLQYLGMTSQPDIFGLTTVSPSASRNVVTRTARVRPDAAR